MEKSNYYVKVGTGEVLPDKTMSEWEFEIQATPEQASMLEEALRDADKESWENFFQAHIPIKEYSSFHQIDDYDHNLKHAYEAIHALGTKETKEHIESMGILDE
ncbi:hypothetical protein JOD43_004027 [Pullulanibacillus pueri]|uniref:Hydrolase n=1 Tax=Pullulanibacillus pueri TaxID=1437324 RepID=A0A8J3A0U7_9BACL|nr:hypothetical protein [Pullulanibacillus pueri]MBM7683836.1 hypothetical protein [Pullulanibacillus pueri]GGH87732.1 hypothetical protein GCM10007096_38420 [Pullulanibacillus pueri]